MSLRITTDEFWEEFRVHCEQHGFPKTVAKIVSECTEHCEHQRAEADKIFNEANVKLRRASEIYEGARKFREESK